MVKNIARRSAPLAQRGVFACPPPALPSRIGPSAGLSAQAEALGFLAATDDGVPLTVGPRSPTVVSWTLVAPIDEKGLF
ncbi:hypothetical protein [Stieleria neptunia]|uniref:hypothetical protein n=1 Tax=Stieleria neptunia TaxID=2527979 RepID=UPI0011A11174|nr:hypothetical protein [Stieleria neptunia]